jgi:preprotein translocase subunit SecG
MLQVVLVIHLFLALAIIGLALIQRSEGGGLGIGGSGGLGGLATPMATANILTRATAFCFAGFVITSLTLAVLSGHAKKAGSIMDKVSAATAQEVAKPQEPMGDQTIDMGNGQKIELKMPVMPPVGAPTVPPVEGAASVPVTPSETAPAATTETAPAAPSAPVEAPPAEPVKEPSVPVRD